jgi:hypothetical protein
LPVDVVDAQANIHVPPVGGFQHQHLIAADPGMAVAQARYPRRVRLKWPGASVKDDEIVAGPVHLDEAARAAQRLMQGRETIGRGNRVWFGQRHPGSLWSV